MKKKTILIIILVCVLITLFGFVWNEKEPFIFVFEKPVKLDVDEENPHEAVIDGQRVIVNEANEIMFDSKDYDLTLLDGGYIKITEKYNTFTNRNPQVGLIDLSGEMIIEPRFENVFYDNTLGLSSFIVQTDIGFVFMDEDMNRTSYYFDAVSNDLIKELAKEVENGNMTLEEAQNHAYYNYVVQYKNKQGVVNQYGEVIIPMDYDSLISLSITNQDFLVKVDKFYGVIDQSNEVVIPCELEEFCKGCIIGSENGEGYIDDDGNIILKPVYDGVKKVTLNDEEVFVIRSGQKSAIVDKDLEYVMPYRFYDIDVYYNYLLVTEYGKKGVYKVDFTEVVPIEYDRIIMHEDFIFVIEESNDKGVYDYNGNLLLEVKYPQITIETLSDDVLFECFLDGEWTSYYLSDLIENGE